MKPLLKSLSLLIAITCVVWVAVLWRWQTTQDDRSAGDMALYLVLLPLALFVVVMTARWAFSGIDERTAKRNAASGTTAPQAAATATAGVAELMATMQLLAAPLHCAAGSTAQALAAAIDKQRPGLDKQLLDDDGLPVVAARIDSLDVDALSPPLGMAETLARHRDPAWASLDASPSIGRALAALSPCLDNIFQVLRPWRERLDVTSIDVTQPAASAQAAPARVLVYAAWPQDATPYDRAVADLWLQRAIDERREGIVAAGRIVRPPAEPVLTGPALLRHADEAMVRMRRESATNDLVLLIGAESHVVESSVHRWQREGLLCTSRNPKGRVPGEAAAALLLAPVAWPHDSDEPCALLHRPPIAARDKSVDAAGRIDAKVAIAMVEQAIGVTGLEPTAIGMVISDADQTTPRALETYATARGPLSHLDAAEDVALTGTVCGHIGAVSTLVAIALAAHRALESEKPCLALSVGDALARAAIVVRPPLPAPVPAAAATQATAG